MISKDRSELIEKEIKKDSNYISRLTDAELMSYESYLVEKIKDKKAILSDKRKHCEDLLNKIKS